MSTAEILSLISTICYVIAAISFVLAVFFWFSFKILSVIGDLSGRTARKSIAKMRANNEKVGGVGYGPSKTNENRGKLTDTMQHASGVKAEVKTNQMPPRAVPEKKGTETELLSSDEMLFQEEEQTAFLDGSEATGLLNAADVAAPRVTVSQPTARRNANYKLTMLDDVMLIHTDEVI